ncbi:MAG: hypothetical protein FJ095_19895 [Deltaproteobacteria bacterium]|nr:hypothetical protein [Deltaproteobacteria bacterium]
MKALALVSILAVASCQSSPAESEGGGGAPPVVEPVVASFQLVDAATGKGFAGGTLTLGQATAVTDAQGRATLDVPPGAFDVTLTGPNLATYTLAGAAGAVDFSFISYVSTRKTTSQVAGLLGTKVDPTRGILVVAADDPQLKPAVGAKVALDAEAGAPFVIGPTGPKPGDTVVAGGSFVSFFNVAPGSVRIELTPPAGKTCHVAPGPGPRDTVEVLADGVTVIAYVCE